MSKARNSKPRFRVGDWVSFPFGIRIAVAQIIEDRGPIGVERRRFYRVELPLRESDPDRFEMPEDQMSPATAPPEKNGTAS
jgi:hypothetical protein